jgi:hypothetical protein
MAVHRGQERRSALGNAALRSMERRRVPYRVSVSVTLWQLNLPSSNEHVPVLDITPKNGASFAVEE